MGQQKVTFKPGMVSTTIRSGNAMSFPIVGYILARKEPSFYTEEGMGWCKLIDGRGYAFVDTYFATIENQNPPPPPTPVTPPNPVPVTPTTKETPDDRRPVDYDAINEQLQSNREYEQYNTSFDSQLHISGRGKSSFNDLEAMRDDVQINDYFMDYSFIEENLKIARNNLNLLNNEDLLSIKKDLFNKFNRFKVVYPDYQLSKSFAYVFFTRPDLNILDEGDNRILASQLKNEPLYYYLSKNSPDILLSLTKYLSANHDLFPKLCDTAQSFEISDEYIKTMEHGETFSGYKVQYGKNNIESKTAGTFSVSYIDDNEFNVYKIHKAWIDYISKIYRGELKAKNEYRYAKILDYACAVYYILCGPDAETVLFWTKYFGVFPTNAPSSIFSWSKNNLLKVPEYSINYAYAFKEEFSPLTLAEFNMNSRGSYVYKKIYEPDTA
jgi:hypothetical protein